MKSIFITENPEREAEILEEVLIEGEILKGALTSLGYSNMSKTKINQEVIEHIVVQFLYEVSNDKHLKVIDIKGYQTLFQFYAIINDKEGKSVEDVMKELALVLPYYVVQRIFAFTYGESFCNKLKNIVV